MIDHNQRRSELVTKHGEETVSEIEQRMYAELEEAGFLTNCQSFDAQGKPYCDDSKCGSNQTCKKTQYACHCVNN